MADWPYSTRRWQRVRSRQLAREPLCRACSQDGKITPATEVDHLKRIEDGGDVWSPDNLQSLCKPHHSLKTGAFDMQGKDWRKYELRGCDEHGNPRDPEHEWNKGDGGSISGSEGAGTAAGATNKVSCREIG